jgi:predicted nicotinamide N-methyase
MACDWDAGGSLTGATVWDASFVLAAYLPRALPRRSCTRGESGGDTWGGVRVLELGAGAGLLAIVAAQLGAKTLATDADERVLALCARNARANGLTEVSVRCSRVCARARAPMSRGGVTA